MDPFSDLLAVRCDAVGVTLVQERRTWRMKWARIVRVGREEGVVIQTPDDKVWILDGVKEVSVRQPAAEPSELLLKVDGTDVVVVNT